MVDKRVFVMLFLLLSRASLAEEITSGFDSVLENPQFFTDNPNKADFQDGDGVNLGNQMGQDLPIVQLGYFTRTETGTLRFSGIWCSAAMVSLNKAITAKHCLEESAYGQYELFAISDKAHIERDFSDNYIARVIGTVEPCILGWCKENSEKLFVRKTGELTVEDYSRNDYALLELAQNLGAKTGFFKIHPANKPLPPNVNIGGYPQHISILRGEVFKYIVSGCDIMQDENLIYTNCIGQNGMSGGPIYYEKEGKMFLISVFSQSLPLYLQVDQGFHFLKTVGISYSPFYSSQMALDLIL